MARIRSLKPEFCTSERIAELSIPCRLHFALLWTYADDFGRGLDNPRLIKAALWPLDDEVGAEQVEAWQAELESKGRVRRYESGGRRLFEVVNFEEHQHPQKKAAESVFDPPPDDYATSTRPLQEPDATDTEEASSVVVGEGSGEVEVEGVVVAPAPRPRDDIWDALTSALECEPHTESERGAWNKARKELAAAEATPEQIHHRADEYRRRWPNMTLSPNALARHWGELATKARNGQAPNSWAAIEAAGRNP